MKIKVRLETDHQTKRFATLNWGWMGEILLKTIECGILYQTVFFFTSGALNKKYGVEIEVLKMVWLFEWGETGGRTLTF